MGRSCPAANKATILTSSFPATDSAVGADQATLLNAHAMPPECRTSRATFFIAAALLTLMTLAVYAQVGQFNFINFDDPTYVVENPHMQRGLNWQTTVWAFTTFHFANWHPLTWLSYLLDAQLFGQNPAAFHLTNLVWHLASALVLLRVIQSMTGRIWPSFFVAALFAVHPLHVESVAWVSERKDVISTLFGFLALGLYARYARRPTWQRQLPVLVALSLGLMAKQMVVTLPCVMLLLDYWPLRRWSPFSDETSGNEGASKPEFAPATPVRLILEKLPLFAVAAASCAICYVVQRSGGAVRTFDRLPLEDRLRNAAVSYIVYIGKTLVPTGLTPFYPFEIQRWNWPLTAVTGLFLMMFSVLVVRQAQRRPALFVGWFWYLGTLVPVIGLIQVGLQARADRYTYLPLVGLFLALTWEVAERVPPQGVRRIMFQFGSAAVLACLVVMAWRQTSLWQNSLRLFSHTLAVNPHNYRAHSCLAQVLREMGQTDASLEHARAAVALKPTALKLRNNLAISLVAAGRFDEAILEYTAILKITPASAETLRNLAVAQARAGDLRAAQRNFERARTALRDDHHLWRELGAVYERLDRTDAAIDAYRRAVALDARDDDAAERLARLLAHAPRAGKPAPQQPRG